MARDPTDDQRGAALRRRALRRTLRRRCRTRRAIALSAGAGSAGRGSVPAGPGRQAGAGERRRDAACARARPSGEAGPGGFFFDGGTDEPRVSLDEALVARGPGGRPPACGRSAPAWPAPAASSSCGPSWPTVGRVLVTVRDVTAGLDGEVRRLQSEKLAAIGMLAAGVAHEINNPASFVLANTEALGGLLRHDRGQAAPRSGQRAQAGPARPAVRGHRHRARVEGGHGPHPPDRPRSARLLPGGGRSARGHRRQRRRRLRPDHAAQRAALPGPGRAHAAWPPDRCEAARPASARCS